jgi:hypothetical protein
LVEEKKAQELPERAPPKTRAMTVPLKAPPTGECHDLCEMHLAKRTFFGGKS